MPLQLSSTSPAAVSECDSSRPTINQCVQWAELSWHQLWRLWKEPLKINKLQTSARSQTPDKKNNNCFPQETCAQTTTRTNSKQIHNRRLLKRGNNGFPLPSTYHVCLGVGFPWASAMTQQPCPYKVATLLQNVAPTRVAATVNVSNTRRVLIT